jgi:hypothetical protein
VQLKWIHSKLNSWNLPSLVRNRKLGRSIREILKEGNAWPLLAAFLEEKKHEEGKGRSGEGGMREEEKEKIRTPLFY